MSSSLQSRRLLKGKKKLFLGGGGRYGLDIFFKNKIEFNSGVSKREATDGGGAFSIRMATSSLIVIGFKNLRETYITSSILYLLLHVWTQKFKLTEPIVYNGSPRPDYNTLSLFRLSLRA